MEKTVKHKRLTKKEKLNHIYDCLKAGATVICNGCRMVIAPGRTARGIRNLIFYQRFGSSAVSATKSDLKWLLDTIAGSQDYAFELEM